MSMVARQHHPTRCTVPVGLTIGGNQGEKHDECGFGVAVVSIALHLVEMGNGPLPMKLALFCLA
jgi:hypothetical protein